MLRLFEMFSGFGGANFALKKAKINYVSVGHSEIDKFAIECWNKNHQPISKLADELPNFGDCTKINPHELPDFDLLTAGFPCQSFSVAGKGLGEQDTRGTLFHDIIRIAEVKKPRYMLLENVKGLTTKRHRETFDKILSELYRIGYCVKWKVLNSKEHGIPQNRERVFFVCFRDFVECGNFAWPEKEELTIFLKDILEDSIPKDWEDRIDELENKIITESEQMELNGLLYERELRKVDEKYYLKESTIKNILFDRHGNISEKITNTITATANSKNGSQANIIQLNKPNHSNDRVYSSDGVSPSLNTMQGGNRQPFISVKNATKKGYLEGYPNDGVNLEQPNSATRRGRIQKNVMGTLQTNDQRGVITEDFRIRKLTPKECFRLMGFNDEINLDGIKVIKSLLSNRKHINLWEIKKNAKLLLVNEKQEQKNTETYASFIIREKITQEQLDKHIELDLQGTLNVGIAIRKLEKQEQKDCATNIIKCEEITTEMLYTQIKENYYQKSQGMRDVSMVVQHTKSLWKVTLKGNYSQEKLFIISMVINSIIQGKIFICVKTEANIQLSINNLNILPSNLLEVDISNLKMAYMSTPLSNSQRYKLAGNGWDINLVSKILGRMLK